MAGITKLRKRWLYELEHGQTDLSYADWKIYNRKPVAPKRKGKNK